MYSTSFRFPRVSGICSASRYGLQKLKDEHAKQLSLVEAAYFQQKRAQVDQVRYLARCSLH